MKPITLAIQEKGVLILVYMANFFLSFHYFTTAYINSSFLSGINLSQSVISILYIVAAVINTVILIYASKLLRKFTNYKVTLFTVVLDFIAVLGLATAGNLVTSIMFFLMHQALVPFLMFNLDIYLEHQTKNEALTGEIRGGFLTVVNAALVISPLLIAIVGITAGNYSPIYFLSSLFLVPLFLIILISLKNEAEPEYSEFILRRDIKQCLNNKNITNVFGANFVLQIFYSFMVIYMPIYLHEIMGFSWTEIGLILGIAMLPFLLFEFPIGVVADRILGEKEMMVFGFMIISVFLLFIPLIKVQSFTLFAFLMFMTRVGAALVETTTESYFFKQTKDSRADLISVFRMTRPLSFILGPLIAFFALYFTSMAGLFIMLSGIILMGIPFALKIVDSR